eukprot:scaffold2311_cov32-Phaeocystis_antarctica.AAC.1
MRGVKTRRITTALSQPRATNPRGASLDDWSVALSELLLKDFSAPATCGPGVCLLRPENRTRAPVNTSPVLHPGSGGSLGVDRLGGVRLFRRRRNEAGLCERHARRHSAVHARRCSGQAAARGVSPTD